MKLLKLALFGVVMIGLQFSGVAFALDPELCDSSEDPDCQCPGDDSYDVCYQETPSDLTSPDDPVALRNAANITSEWNDELEAYEVEIDVTQLTAGGVIKLHSNQGRWESFEELRDYIGQLIGQDVTEYEQELPPLVVRQRGLIGRYDQFREDWAEVRVRSLIDGVITNSSGDIRLGDSPFFDIFAEFEECHGVDDKAHDSEVTNDFAADQCSGYVDQPIEDCRGTGDGGLNCDHTLPYKFAETDLDVRGAILLCDTDNGDCDPDDSGIIHVRRDADYLELDSYFFDGGAGPFETPHFSETDTQSIVETGDLDNGVCAHGTAEDDGVVIELSTRDGSYDSNHPSCDF